MYIVCMHVCMHDTCVCPLRSATVLCRLCMYEGYVCIYYQCSKLRVHPAPCVHILAAGCIDFSNCAPGGCMVFPHYEYLYTGMYI